MEILMNLQSKIRRGKEFFGKEHIHPTVNIAFQPEFQKAFQLGTASAIARQQSGQGKSKCRSSDRITFFIYLHIFITLPGLNCTQKEKGILILVQHTDLHCIVFQVQRLQAHCHTKIICCLCSEQEKNNHFDQFAALKCPII